MKNTLHIFLLFIFSQTVIVNFTVAQNTPWTIEMNDVEADVGNDFSVPLVLNGRDSLISLNLSYEWDFRFLEFKSIDLSSEVFAEDLSDFRLQGNFEGRAYLSISLAANNLSLIESDTLAVLTFTALQEGSSYIRPWTYRSEPRAEQSRHETSTVHIGNLPPRQLNLYFSQSDKFFKRRNDILFLDPLLFPELGVIEEISFDVHYDSSALRLDPFHQSFGIGRSFEEIQTSKIPTGSHVSWSAGSEAGFEIDRGFNLVFREVGFRDTLVKIWADNFRIKNALGDSIRAAFDTARISMVRNYPNVDLITLTGTETALEKYILDTVYFTVRNLDNINSLQFDLWTPYNAVITDVGPYAPSFQGEPLDFEKEILEEGKMIRTTWNFPENYIFSLGEDDTLCYVTAYIDQDYRSSARVELEGLDLQDVQGNQLRSSRPRAALLLGIDPPNLENIIWGSGFHFVAQNDTFAFPVYFTSEYLNELSYFRFDHLYNNAAFRLIDIVPGDDLHASESSNIIYPWEGENYPGLFSVEWDPETLPDQIVPEGKDMIMPYQLLFVAEGRPGDLSSHSMRRYMAQTRENSPVNLDFGLSFWGSMEVADKADMALISLDSISGPVDSVVTVGMYFENLQEVETISLDMEFDDKYLEVLDARIVSDSFGRAANIRLNSNEIDFNYDIRYVIFPSDTLEPVSLLDRERVLELDFRIKQAGCSSIKRRIIGHNFFRAPDSTKIANLSNHRPYQFEQGVVCGELGTALENLVTPDLNIYPNPTTNQVTLSYPDDLQVEKICLRDLSGRIIQEWDGRQENLDVRGLQGLYYLEIFNSKGNINKKLIIQSKQ